MSLDTTLIQKALYDALVAANVAGGRIYDGDQGQGQSQTPYVVIGEWDMQADDSTLWNAVDCVATLHVWSTAQGAKQAQAVCDAIRTALHQQPLTISGAHCPDVQVRSVGILVDPDEKHRHAILRVALNVSKAET